MMKPIRPNVSKGGTYPQEFREEAVRYWLSISHSVAIVAKDLGVSEPCLRAWRRQSESSLSTPTSTETDLPSTSSTSEFSLAREISQLRRDLEAMTRQRDILKKAISIFSRAGNVSARSRDGDVFALKDRSDL